MVQENDSDFFYACDSHLSDPGFATLDAASQEAERKKREREAEIEELKKTWNDRPQAKKSSSKDADAEKDKHSEGSGDKDSVNDKSKDTSGKSADTPPALPPSPPPTRKIYELNKGIMNLRYSAKRRAAQERRTKAMLETPGLFPKAPSHKPQ